MCPWSCQHVRALLDQVGGWSRMGVQVGAQQEKHKVQSTDGTGKMWGARQGECTPRGGLQWWVVMVAG